METSNMTMIDREMEFAEEGETSYPGEAETYYGEEGEEAEGESYGAESSLAARRRRARQRELERRRRLARARAPQRFLPVARREAPTARTAVAAVRNLDLETKVQDDILRARQDAQDRRLRRAEIAAVAAVVSGQLQASLQGRVSELNNPYVSAALRAAPLLFLSPGRRGSGAGSYASDPRVIGGALVLGLAFVGDRLKRLDETADVRQVGVADVPVNGTSIFLADALDSRGAILADKAAVFSSSNDTIATIDQTGKVTGVAAGVVVITVRIDDIERRAVLTVT
jgi:hypothetical protein